MSEQAISFFFSCNADKSAHDHTLYVQQSAPGANTVTIGARYRNANPSHLYEIELDPADLISFGNMCQQLGKIMESQGEGMT
jgi:hypothetical protein